MMLLVVSEQGTVASLLTKLLDRASLIMIEVSAEEQYKDSTLREII